MIAYLIIILMHDGSRGAFRGKFADDWKAIDAGLAAFHDARSIVPRREAA